MKSSYLPKLIENNFSPYRLLFTTGIFAAVAGVLLWLFLDFGILSFYPRPEHGSIMFFSFLWCFVMGFLMTAIPKMTASKSAKNWEVYLIALLTITQIAFQFNHGIEVNKNIEILILLIQGAFAVQFILKRVIKRKSVPFEGFAFMPFAFLCYFYGLFLLAKSEVGQYQQFFLFSGHAFISNLIFGIGSRLIPALSRIPETLRPDQVVRNNKWFEFFAFAIWLNASFFIQTYFNTELGLAVRAAFLAIYSIKHLRLAKWPPNPSFLSIGFRISGVFLILGTILQIAFPYQRLAALHFEYIGGLSLLTLMVASRVSLAHNGIGTEPEFSKSLFIPLISLICVSVILRFLAAANSFSVLIEAAVVTFSVSCLYWLFRIGLKKLN